METNWNKERGGITEVDGAVFVNAGKYTPLIQCIGRDATGNRCETMGTPSNPNRPEWGFLCSQCSGAPARRGSRNSTGYSALTPQSAE